MHMSNELILHIHEDQKLIFINKLTKRRLQQCVDTIPTIMRRMDIAPKE
jgi:hypothetical protein